MLTFQIYQHRFTLIFNCSLADLPASSLSLFLFSRFIWRSYHGKLAHCQVFNSDRHSGDSRCDLAVLLHKNARVPSSRPCRSERKASSSFTSICSDHLAEGFYMPTNYIISPFETCAAYIWVRLMHNSVLF